jgi:hypothetical protein
MHRVYMRRKRGEEPVRYILPELEPILETTYGVITYQEQVMRVAQTLAGMTFGITCVVEISTQDRIDRLQVCVRCFSRSGRYCVASRSTIR